MRWDLDPRRDAPTLDALIRKWEATEDWQSLDPLQQTAVRLELASRDFCRRWFARLGRPDAESFLESSVRARHRSRVFASMAVLFQHLDRKYGEPGTPLRSPRRPRKGARP